MARKAIRECACKTKTNGGAATLYSSRAIRRRTLDLLHKT